AFQKIDVWDFMRLKSRRFMFLTYALFRENMITRYIRATSSIVPFYILLCQSMHTTLRNWCVIDSLEAYHLWRKQTFHYVFIFLYISYKLYIVFICFLLSQRTNKFRGRL